MLVRSQMYYRIRSIVSLLILSLLFGCMPTAQHKQATHLSQIDEILSHSGYKAEDILVVFDFNYTLMYPLVPCLHKSNIDKNKREFKAVISRLSHEKADEMLSRMMASTSQKLINDALPSFF